MAELDLSVVPALAPSPPAWIEAVAEDFTAFLQDHASAEKKASGMALNVASHYPDQPQLLSAMADLAVEELTHYREVIRIMLARDVHPAPDSKDPYIHQLNRAIRKGPAEFLLDRLLIGAVIAAPNVSVSSPRTSVNPPWLGFIVPLPPAKSATGSFSCDWQRSTAMPEVCCRD